ncbi:RNA-dependent RNA polymerase, partial [Erinaceus virus H14]
QLRICAWTQQCHANLHQSSDWWNLLSSSKLEVLNQDGTVRGNLNFSRISNPNTPKGKLRRQAACLSVERFTELPPCKPGTFSMIPPPRGWPVYGVNCQCVHNEIIAIMSRTLVPNKPVDPEPLLETMLKVLPKPAPRIARHEELVAMFPQSRRKRYRRPLAKTFHSWSPTINAFTKMERIPVVKRGKVKAPRLIQARFPEFNYLLASFTKPLEHTLYNWRVNGKRVIAKGLNLEQRANLLWDIWHSLTNPCCLSLDCTDWDGHVVQALLKAEHAYYLQCFANNPQLAMLLQQQLRNKGRTQTGLRYLSLGGRASGDMNTALGNCVLAASLAFHVIYTVTPDAIAQRKAYVVCDGDDTLLIADLSITDQIIRSGPAIYDQFGQVLRVDGVAHDFWQIEFCQSKPFRRSDGLLVMSPDPKKVLQTSFMATGSRAFDRAYFGTLWEQRARTHTGVPCFAKLFARLARANTARLSTMHFFGFEHVSPNLPDAPIGQAERALFEYQWGLSQWEQIAWEEAEVSFSPELHCGTPAAWGT